MTTDPRHHLHATPDIRWEEAMTEYQPKQRVVLVHTDDPHTRLRPGDTGTVLRHDTALNTVYMQWDDGSQLAMCLDAGDRIRVLLPAATSAQPDTDPDSWQTTLQQMRTAGADAGRTAADWWEQDTVGGRAGGDVRGTARRILTGIDDGDPAVLDTVPSPDVSGQWADTPSEADLYTAATGASTADWHRLGDTAREDAIDAYRDAFQTAVLQRVTELCHLAASPTGRDVSHLHPDRVRIGGVGVFAGDWVPLIGDGDRIAVGFVGTLIDIWNGWAVFTCTRAVAEAIVADQQQHRRELRELHLAQGVDEKDVDRHVDAEMADLRFDGDVIVADQRSMYDDAEAIEYIRPNQEGTYVVMGWNWCWEAVDPYDCDHIVGELPEPADQQQWVLLPHSWLRVPHDRLTITEVHRTPTRNATAYTATLHLDGQPVGELRNDGTGGDTELAFTASLWGPEHMADYVAACRRNGEPATEQQVIEALITEYETHQTIRGAEATAAAVVRMLDEHSTVLEVRTATPAPRGSDELRRLGRMLAASNSGVERWEIWTGRRWQLIPASSSSWHDAAGSDTATP